MTNPERIVPPEEARELFKQMHEVVEEHLEVQETPDETKILRPKQFRSGAGSQHEWEKEKEKIEDARRARREAA